MSYKINSFLDLIAWCEGTYNNVNSKNNGYDVIVSGIDSPKILNDYSQHPAILVTVNRKGLKSTAAGRYQFLLRYWKAYALRLGLTDFSPESQDRAAIEVLRETGALPLILRGEIAKAIAKCCHIWASLPGSPYGQPVKELHEALEKYQFFLSECRSRAVGESWR